MAQNTRFAMSVQALCMLAEGDQNHTSQDLAEALRTNPVVIRRALAALQNAGIISSTKGPNGGSRLARSPKQISLADIYRATEAARLLHAPDLDSPSQRGSASAALRGILKKAQGAFEDSLEQTSLNQLVKKAAKKAKK